MDTTFDFNKAKGLLDSGMQQAGELLKNPGQIGDLLKQAESKIKGFNLPQDLIRDVPLMISMVKGYITREYTNVSPKVIILLVSAFLYLVKKNDLIPDSIPVLGYVDDIAVLALAIKLCEPELKAYDQWRRNY